jgi:hypothetical protein
MESGNEIKQGKIKRNEWGVILSHPFLIYPYTLSFPYSPFLSHRKVTTFFEKVTTFSSPPQSTPHPTITKSYNLFLPFIHISTKVIHNSTLFSNYLHLSANHVIIVPNSLLMLMHRAV